MSGVLYLYRVTENPQKVTHLHDYRQSYERYHLTEDQVPILPISLFEAWFREADAANAGEANAMTLSTVDAGGFPSGRVVLLKAFDEAGFTFFTHYNSDKGKAIAAHPSVCLSFFWGAQQRQVIVRGKAEKVSNEESEAYFASRPRGSQMGALASEQSQVVPHREFLDNRLQELEKQYEGRDIPKPKDWGGYLVRPETIEFWQGRPNRLHDRLRYSKSGQNWILARLSP